MEKILIIKSKVDLFFNYFDNVERYFWCSISNPFLRILRKFKFPLYIFLGKWKKNVKKFSTFILFDNGYSDYISKYIKKNNPNSRIILWYWNSFVECNSSINKSKNIDEVWTYNLIDANIKKMKYNTQFYSKNVVLPHTKNEYDVIFVGSDKGRKVGLLDLEKRLKDLKIRTFFKIVEKKSDYISYADYLTALSKSKCVIDYCISENKCGLSLRVMESIFLGKKLITNNHNVKDYDFYNKNNIFIIGIDDEQRLFDFINSKYEKITDKIIEKYDFPLWLDRFKKR